MVQFVVKGPFDVPLRKGVSGGTYVNEELLEGVLALSPDLSKPGCYVFACTSSRGSLPVYVGQASKNIFKESFNVPCRTADRSQRPGVVALPILIADRLEELRDRLATVTQRALD